MNYPLIHPLSTPLEGFLLLGNTFGFINLHSHNQSYLIFKRSTHASMTYNHMSRSIYFEKIVDKINFLIHIKFTRHAYQNTILFYVCVDQ